MNIFLPAGTKQGFWRRGPTLRPKIAEKNERDFTEDKVNASREGYIGLQAGTNKLASPLDWE